MIRKLNSGQTSLILILLTAAALIFLAITLNWGRVAQTKVLLTVAADESASLLASNAASYGEMEKQTYLKNTNYQWGLTGVLLDIILVIISVVVAILSFGVGGVIAASFWGEFIAVTAAVMAAVSLALQLVVVSPGISSLWNGIQKNQPVQQQFYEQGVSSALQGSVGDQVNITDYFDSNGNGVFGTNAAGFPKDIVGRFALFYSDRLKMLNQADIPQVVFFDDQLGELMGGETCAQSGSDNYLYGFPFNSAACPADCIPTALNPVPGDPACQLKIPNSFQLNDSCTDSNPGSSTYNPYCDPCCQTLSVPDPGYSSTKPNPLHPNPNIAVRPSSCDQGTTYNGAPVQCLTNNPYGATTSNYANIPTLLYDPAYQEYANQTSFLDQFGRDQQMGPFSVNLTPQGNFPNGIFPFFWLMKDYSPEVDNIDPAQPLSQSQVHWCTAAVTTANGAYSAPTGYTDLAQLTLPYSCTGVDCCVNHFPNSVTNVNGVSIPAGVNSDVMDIVGSVGTNPVLDSSLGEGGSGSWLEGDDQSCSTSWRYNGATSSVPDGTCEWTGSANAPTNNTVPPNNNNSDIENGITVDGLDDTMHTLSDFVNFANTLLGQDVGTLSSSFDTWYPQAAQWIAPACVNDPPENNTCNPGQNGRLLNIYNPYTGVDVLSGWNTLITNWLNNNYTSTTAWCVPPQNAPSLNVNGVPTTESNYIAANGASLDANDPKINSTWGDLGYVTACMNYNSNQSVSSAGVITTPAAFGGVYNYQQCQNLLTSACPSSPSGNACDPSILGRSLKGQAPTFDGCRGNYAAWVNDSLTLATDEAPKFALRAQYLNDIYTKAQTMQTAFTQGDAELKKFFLPCAGINCADGGPAAQLIYARSQPTPTALLPNSVIYGWVDKPLPNGQTGYAHIVKVTVYSPGRNGSAAFVSSLLPWIKTTTHLFTRDYELRNRDGYVYVSVKRWDQDHSNSLLFPNGHPLWQFLFHNPQASSVAGTGLPQSCLGTYPDALSSKIGIGLEPQTANGLAAQITSQDQASLANAFMLNDEGTGSNAGKVDPNATNGTYTECLSAVNTLLANAPESHACAEYIASKNASGPSGQNDADYSLKFVSCPSIPSEDLGSSQ